MRLRVANFCRISLIPPDHPKFQLIIGGCVRIFIFKPNRKIPLALRGCTKTLITQTGR